MLTTQNEDNRRLAQTIAKRTEDAYSFSRYEDWADCALAILDLGYNEVETETILRSKWTRWAADIDGADYGIVKSQAIVHVLKNPHVMLGKKADLRKELDKMLLD